MSTVKRGYVRPVDFKHGRVDMTHGSGRRVRQRASERASKVSAPRRRGLLAPAIAFRKPGATR